MTFGCCGPATSGDNRYWRRSRWPFNFNDLINTRTIIWRMWLCCHTDVPSRPACVRSGGHRRRFKTRLRPAINKARQRGRREGLLALRIGGQQPQNREGPERPEISGGWVPSRKKRGRGVRENRGTHRASENRWRVPRRIPRTSCAGKMTGGGSAAKSWRGVEKNKGGERPQNPRGVSICKISVGPRNAPGHRGWGARRAA